MSLRGLWRAASGSSPSICRATARATGTRAPAPRPRRRCRAARPEALARGLERLKAADLRTALPLVRVPALVIAGRLDRITRAAAGRALAAALPRARYVEFARAAHAPFLSSPARFAQLLTEFLRA